jgi:hypothetical protein
MAFFIDRNTQAPQHVDITADVHKEALDLGINVATLLNRRFSASVDTSRGSAFHQLCASEGLVIPEANDFGMRAAIIGDILDGKSLIEAAGPSNQGQKGSPFGSAARVLYPVAIIDIVEDILARERETDTLVFDQMVAQRIAINGENFIQPVISYSGSGGPEKARAQHASEFAPPPNMLQISTAERIRSLPAFTMGIEFSDKAQRALTIDVVAASIARFTAVERDQRVYGYLSALFNGDNDLVTGAIPAVTSTTLNGSATAGALTHKAWVKFLARYRKYRQITHLVMDIDTYLKVEGRSGRPGSNNYDPTLARIDPQALPVNKTNIGFGNDVQYFIVDSAAEGGPVPANTVWAIDARKAITKVTNTSANYSATEAFVLRRSTAMRWDWSEAVYRQFGDTELRPFDVLTID